MIKILDNLLRDLLLNHVNGLNSEDQVRFQPPDEDWRRQVGSLQQIALNVYLVDLRENRKLRSNESTRSIDNGIVKEVPAPARLDCHYLITAWSPGETGPAVEPGLDEHSLLYEVTAVLMNHYPLNPSRIYPKDSKALNALPEMIRDTDLNTEILPSEGFPKLAEFWGAMGANHRWKPVLYLIVTIPVALEAGEIGPMVTTRITEYRQTGRRETDEVYIQIGGRVLAATSLADDEETSMGVAHAVVALESAAGESLQATETDPMGRFTFKGLRSGRYRLRYRATGLEEKIRDIDVPAATGDYDLKFEKT